MNRRRTSTWLLLSLACLLGVFLIWRLNGPSQTKNSTAQPTTTTGEAHPSLPSTNATPKTALVARGARLKYRLSNTSQTFDQLIRTDYAISLENALIDSSRPLNFSIPDSLKSKDDSGSYIVQSRGPINNAFRALLQEAGATIVSYIPKNAFLVRMSASAAQQLAGQRTVQAAIPFEPYYKLDMTLLKQVMEKRPTSPSLNVLVFPDARMATLDTLKQLGAKVVTESPSPFGTQMVVNNAFDAPAIARIPGIQRVEMYSDRKPANDLSRARVGVAADTLMPTNYLDLTGQGVTVQVNDSGVDRKHPDLIGRVFSLFAAGRVDSSGHGTHVAGIIGGNGAESMTVSNAYGSIMPGTNGQFRGMAPLANLFSIPLFFSDFFLQQTAATNALISNNSWNYNNTDYDINAASYDAAVRDALPGTTGSQPVLFVFSAGNGGSLNLHDGPGGNGADNGQGGNPESIQSPATAKNVITVGAIEQPRNITNSVAKHGQTNQLWSAMTDSQDQVAGFSGRGNVGIGIEGGNGRFKPDVVAPGTFVVSTRSTQWNEPAYYSNTNFESNGFQNQTVNTNGLNSYSIFVPANTLQLTITVFNANPAVNVPIYVNQTDIPTAPADFVANNQVVLTPPTLLTGNTLFYGIGDPTTLPVTCDIQTTLVTTNDVGDYYDVLKQLNDSLDGTNQTTHYYRYESGTSMSAADVSGVLALMQEFFQKNSITNSPAMMKALLINGARSVNTLYNFQVKNTINYQGWGLINLPNSIPITLASNISSSPAILTQGPSPVLMFDQSPTNALATGDSHTIMVKVDTNTMAQTKPLRITLVWTDPPGNPAAGAKLVNDLDLIVTNLDTGEFFVGNDIRSGSDFTFPADTNAVPDSDVINNVENVYLAPALGSSYSITVLGRAVNVNAVTAHTNNIVQDYALVISSGNGETNGLSLLQPDAGVITAGFTNVTIMTNQFGADSPNIFGQILTPQRVGANSPLIGTNTVPYVTTNGLITLGETNQWHFYVITNATSFTNVVFATSLPLNLAPSRIGVTGVADQATRAQADIDLYVTTDASLLTLNSSAVAAADKSLGRGGFEQIVYSNAVAGRVYYIGVKSEDQQAAEYQFTVLFSLFPFNSGNNTYPGFPTPATIPDGSPALPGKVSVTAYAVADPGTKVRRVVVTNTITHENFGDLLGNFGHDGEKFSVLNNHTFGNGNLKQTMIYEDSGGNNILGAQHTDGPGSLTDFIGDDINGQWTLIEVDNALTHTGRVDQLTIHIDPHVENGLPPGGTNGVVLANCVDVAPNGIEYDFVGVPFNAISIQILLTNIAPIAPLQLVVRNNALPTPATFDYTATLTNGSSLTVSLADLPPLQSGTLFFGIYNSNSVSVQVCYQVTLTVGLAAVAPVIFTSPVTPGISDDAVTTSSVVVTNDRIIASAAVGVVLNHPRVSDMALTLISPTGGRYLLFEDRGAVTATNLGHLNVTTNFYGTQTAGNAQANTNVLAPVPTSGTLIIDYQFFQVPDSMDVYYDGAHIFTTGGLISGAGRFTIPYGPGTGNSITIVMNQGGNPNTQTAWNYTPKVVNQDYSYLTFTEDPSLATVPIKFATPPYDLSEDGTNYILSDFELAASGIYLAPTNIYDARGSWFMTTNAVAFGTNVLSMFTNQVSVATDTNTAQSGSNYLALANGSISRAIPTIVGRKYNLTYWYRGPGLVGWWRGEGNALDSSDPEKLGNNGSLIGSFTFPEGEVGQAFQFEGTNGFVHQPQLPGQSYVQIPQSASLDVGSGGGFTIECWINPTNIFVPQPLVEWLAPIPTNWVPASVGETNGPSFISDTNFAVVAGPFLNHATSHYYYLLASTNWTTSEAWANSLGGHLATVEDANEENWIYDLFAQYGGTNRTLWIGLNDAANPGTFVWADGQTNLFYTNWASTLPASNCPPNQNYVAILNPTNAEASLWALADNNGLTCSFPPTNRIHGVVEVNEIQTNGVQFWVSVTNSLITNNGCLYADVVDTNNASHIIFSPSGLIQTNGMQHVALTYDRSSGIAALYYNGTNVATTNLGIFVPKTGGDVLLGKHMSRETNNVFIGRMDEVSIYNRFLSASEIQSIYSISALSSNRNLGKFDPAITPALGLAEAQVSLGQVTNIILGANTSWQVGSFTFTAATNSMPFQITGIEPGMLLDTFTVTEASPGNLYVLPEESLKDLVGQNAQGTWTLEMRDTRLGANNFAAQLISWQMQFIFQNFTPTAVPLNPFDGATNVVPAGRTAYFTVDVPTWASFATNILVSSTSPVDLLFNQTTPPTGTGVGDFTLFSGTSGIGLPVLSAASIPPLRPGLRYYLGVKNSGAASATVVVRVDFNIIALTNGIPFLTGFGTNDFVRYFAYDVSSNAFEATFQLLNLSSNVDLVIRKGTPLPTLTSSDYGSFNPSQADENIYVLTNSSPVPLSGGRWYLGLFKRDAGLVTNTVLAKEAATPPTIIDLADGVPFTYTAGSGADLTNFFRFTVTNSPRAMHFELYNLSGNVDLTVQTNAPPLAPTFWQSSQQPGRNSELIFIQTNSALTNLNVQWYLGVPNRESDLVTYTILAVIETNVFPAFPGAEGAGAGTIGARGTNGTVYHVVNLNDSGPGSFRDAVSAPFRTVVFDVSGTIALASPLNITSSNLTIAGQTAPGDGITVSGFMTSVENTHDVVLRYLRFRPGNVGTDSNVAWANGFEGTSQQFNVTGYFCGGWHVDSGNVDVLSGYFGSTAYAGTDYLDLNGITPGTISTNLPTVVGKSYRLNFAYSQNPEGNPTAVANILQNGNLLLSLSVRTTNSWTNLKWATTSVVFVATAPTTQIQFASQSPSWYGVLLDDISLTTAETGSGNALQFSNAANVIADHVTATWSASDLVSVLGSTNVTVQWSVIADIATDCSSLTKHSDGSLLRYGYGTLSFHHNLYANNYSANPRLGDNLSLDFVNNVVYDWAFLPGFSLDDSTNNPAGFTNYLNYVCNYLIAGNDFIGHTNNVMPYIAFSGGTTNTWIFQTNNVMDANTNGILDGARTGWDMFTNQYTKFDRAFSLPPIGTDEAFIAYERVLDFAGTALYARDSVDRRIVGNVRTQSGSGVPSPTLTGMVAWWQAESNANDSVGGNNGTLMNGAGFSSGEVGNAFNLDGLDDFVLVNATSNLDVGLSGGFTIEEWVNPTTLAQELPLVEYEKVLGTGSGADVGMLFYMCNPPGSGNFFANILDTTGTSHTINSGPGFVTAGVWQHVAVTYSKASGNATLYLNGAVVLQQNFGSFTPQTSFTNVLLGARTYLGSAANPSQKFAGKLDEISIYSRDLSSCEIEAIYLAGSAGKQPPQPTPLNALPYLDSDQDGIPDYWEITLNENPTNATSNLDRDGDGYSDLEEYINWLAAPHALTLTNTPVDVDLYRLAGNTGNLTFYLTNAVNGTVYLTNRYYITNGTTILSNTVAVFTPTNVPIHFSGFASFGFYVTNTDTVAYFGPETVSVMVSKVPLVTNAPVLVVTLTNQITNCVVSSSGTNGVDYYSYNVSTNAYGVQFQVSGASSNLDLYVRFGLPLPGPGLFDYSITNAGTNVETITILTNMVPVPVTSGLWYLAVSNASGTAPVSYCVTVTELVTLPTIITLTNGIPYAVSNSPAGGTDYYHYVVTNNPAARVQFEVDNPTGDVTLVARRGFPLPSLALYDYISTNAYTNMELIVVFTNSTPVALAPGDWYLAVANVSSFGPVNYSIKATEWPITGEPVAITNFSYSSNDFCITWTSLPGAYYYVQGITSLASTNWVTISPQILATSYSTTYCIPLPSPYNFFRVAEGLVLSTNQAPPIITLTNGIPYLKTSTAANGADYYHYVVTNNPAARVQFEVDNPGGDVTLVARKGLPVPSLASYDYLSQNPSTNDELIVVLTNSTPMALAPGDWYLSVFNVSGGPVTYSVKATEWPVTGSPFNITNSVYTPPQGTNPASFCVTWNSLPGAYYYVQGIANVAATNWVAVSPTILATASSTTYCIPLPSPYNFFRVVEGLALSTNLAASSIIPLTNGVPYLNSNASATNSVDYYRYTVSTNAARVQFEVNNPDGDVTLIARKGLPLPTLGLYDYLSTNSFTNDELIAFFTNSTPALTPGDWYLSVLKVSGGQVTYSVKATEWPVTGLPIGVTNVSLSGGSLCLTWISLPGVYYHVEGVSNLTSTSWIAVSPTILATNTTTTYCIPLPSPYNFFRVVEGLVLSTNLPPSAIITLTNRVSYLNSNAGGTNSVDYYRYNVSTNAIRVQFEVNNPSGDVTLIARKGPPLPTLGSYDYLSTNSFTNDELIVVFTNSTPVALASGDWYLAVSNAAGGPVSYNVKATEWAVTGLPVIVTNISFSGGSFCLAWNSLPGVHYYVQGVTTLTSTNWVAVSPDIVATNTSTTYCVSLPSAYNFFRVAEGLVLSTNLSTSSAIITLTNATPYLNSNSGGTNQVDYYRFVVATNSARAQFEVNNSSGDITLMARKGLPLPTLANSDYFSTNSGTNDELIVVFTNSSPVALTPGDWYIAVTNISSGPVTYSIKATDWPLTGRPIGITNVNYSSNSFCITWTSLPGVYYYVQGIANLASTNWVTISPQISAPAYSTTYCVPLPSPYNFFRVAEGLALASHVPVPVISGSFTNSGFLLRWNGPVSASYQAQWKALLGAASWNNFTNVITSTTGQFSFFDDGSQTASLGATRFYRVRVLP